MLRRGVPIPTAHLNPADRGILGKMEEQIGESSAAFLAYGGGAHALSAHRTALSSEAVSLEITRVLS